jgi:hypothetical protein
MDYIQKSVFEYKTLLNQKKIMQKKLDEIEAKLLPSTENLSLREMIEFNINYVVVGELKTNKSLFDFMYNRIPQWNSSNNCSNCEINNTTTNERLLSLVLLDYFLNGNTQKITIEPNYELGEKLFKLIETGFIKIGNIFGLKISINKSETYSFEIFFEQN